jgi:tetratricopeptide (TPR) repeat protein
VGKRPELESPLPPLLMGLALALVLAALILRTLTTGAGIELNAPGAQLLFDGLALSAASFAAAARALRGEPVLGVDGWTLAALGVWLVLLVASAAGAPHADLAWRTVVTTGALVLLGLTAGDLGRDPRLARLLLGALLACVTTGAALGLWWYAVEQPALQASFESGDAELTEQLALFDASFRQGLRERAYDRAAVGPYVIGNLLACAVATVLPLALAWTWTLRRRPWAVAGALASLTLLGGLLLSGSKGGVLAALAGGGAFVALHPALARHRRRLLGGAAALGLLAALGVGTLYLRAPEARGVGMSLQVRLEYWQAGLAMWRDAPALGQGPNHFREWVSEHKSARAEEALHAHNAEVQVLAETGALGLLSLLAFVALWGRGAWGRLDPDPAPSSDPEPPSLVPAARLPWLASLGFCLGALLLTGYGDYVSVADKPGQLLVVLCLLPALTTSLAVPWPRDASPLLVPAALAGAVAFAASAQIDFSLQHAGTLTVFACVLGLAPRLAGSGPAPSQHPWAGRVAAGLLGVVTLGLVCGVVPGALQADALRTEARELHFAGALAAEQGRRGEAHEQLEPAAQAFGDSLDAYPWNATTWREQAATLDGLGLGREALASLETSLQQNPRGHATWHELGLLLARRERFTEALGALAEALRLYPHHPGLLLDAGSVHADAARALAPGQEREALRQRARELLDRAETASETTRLVLRKLTEAQRRRLLELRAELAEPTGPPRQPPD